MKIQIMGFSGSGKSTLAKRLSEHYKIPALHLDNTHFYDDWKERTDEDQDAIVTKFIEENESWIIDGNYRRICKRRFEECDLLIYLDYNRFYCYRKAKERYKEFKGKIRYSCPCEEKFDFEFRKWILWESRTRKRKKKIKELINSIKGEKLVFKNVKQLNEYLKSQGIN